MFLKFLFPLNYTDVVVAPPFVYLDQVKNSLTDRIEISAQNSWVGKGGAFTGEIRFICSFLLITKKVQSCFTVFKYFKQLSFAFLLCYLKCCLCLHEVFSQYANLKSRTISSMEND